MFAKIFEPVLGKYHPCEITEVRQHVQKEKRIIDTLEPIMNGHRLVVDYDVVREDIKEEEGIFSLFYQMTHLTKDRGALRKDDRIDVLAIAVKYWLEAMSRDEDKSVNAWKEKQDEEEMKKFIDHCLNIGNQKQEFNVFNSAGRR